MPTRKTLSVRVFLVSVSAFKSYVNDDAVYAPPEYHVFQYSKAFCDPDDCSHSSVMGTVMS